MLSSLPPPLTTILARPPHVFLSGANSPSQWTFIVVGKGK